MNDAFSEDFLVEKLIVLPGRVSEKRRNVAKRREKIDDVQVRFAGRMIGTDVLKEKADRSFCSVRCFT